nr:hypothetical protein CFP56_75182 [Quercus suber]
MKESPAAFSAPTYAPRKLFPRAKSNQMAGTRLTQWLNLLVWTLVMLKTEGANVSITIVEDAVVKGADIWSSLSRWKSTSISLG